MRRELAHLLHRWASKLYDARESIEIIDEYNICRCRLIILTDDAIHNIEAKVVQLPEGWRFEEREV